MLYVTENSTRLELHLRRGRKMRDQHRTHPVNPDLLSGIVLLASGLVIVVSLVFALWQALTGR